MTLASVDGCKGGWVIAKAEAWGSAPFFAFCEKFRDVLKATEDCSVVVVDMPIGLPTGREPRSCDPAARDYLGMRNASRVFFTPPREALVASTPQEFQALCRAATGKGAGLPVWGIAPKLKEVDEAMTPTLQERVIEFHPELAWTRLAGKPLSSKHGTHGLLVRLGLLSATTSLNDLAGASEGLPDAVQLDDLLDAFVGLHVAHDFRAGEVNRIPFEEPQQDAHGLRMEIWY